MTVVREFPEAFKGAAMLVKERADNAVHQERLKGFLREQGTETQTFQFCLENPVSSLRFFQTSSKIGRKFLQTGFWG